MSFQMKQSIIWGLSVISLADASIELSMVWNNPGGTTVKVGKITPKCPNCSFTYLPLTWIELICAKQIRFACRCSGQTGYCLSGLAWQNGFNQFPQTVNCHGQSTAMSQAKQWAKGEALADAWTLDSYGLSWTVVWTQIYKSRETPEPAPFLSQHGVFGFFSFSSRCVWHLMAPASTAVWAWRWTHVKCHTMCNCGRICFAFVFVCVESKNRKTPNLSSMADDVITRGGIRGLGSPLYICGF